MTKNNFYELLRGVVTMKRKGVTITLLITLFAVLFYGYRYLKIPVETQAAMLTRLEDTVKTKAYVIREEAVFDAQIPGTMYNYVEEGDRVAKDMRISTVYRGDVEDDLIHELNNVNTRIEKLEAAKAKSEQFVTDSSSAESTTEHIKTDIINAVINNDVSEIENYKNTLRALNDKASEEVGKDLNELIIKRENIEARLSSDKSDITTTISGIFSLNVDGFEDILTPEKIKEFTVNDFTKLTGGEVFERTSNLVNAGEKICKVVDNHTWYAMAVVSKDIAQQIKNKKEVIIRFEGLPGEEVSATLEYMSEEDETSEDALIVLKSDRYLEGVYGMRTDEMEIVINRYTGYEVPIHSLRVVEDKTGVVISGGTSEIFCECDIVYSDEDTGISIVYPSDSAKRKLSIGDKIILGEKKEEA